MKLAFITPTYNRAKEIKELYYSLIKQTDKNFKWIVIDDGSTDNTLKILENLKNEKIIEIEYLRQENNGKGKALNLAFETYENTGINSFVVIDSDDTLLENAVSIIRRKSELYYKNKQVGALFFYFYDKDGNILNKANKKLSSEVILDRYDYNKLFGLNDGCVCYFDRTIKKYKYPVYPGENYIGPTVLQMEMANEFKIAFIPDVVGIAEYLSDGLTAKGRKLRMKNPLGMIHYSGLQQSKKNPFIKRIKNMVGAQAYKHFTDKELLINYGLNKYMRTIFVLPGYLLSVYWKWKLRDYNL